MDRRAFLGAGGAALVCTLAGREVDLSKAEQDWAAIARDVRVPPKARADRAVAAQAQPAVTGRRREHWIQAEPVRWDVVPTRRDAMMDQPVRGRTAFTAWVYRAYTPGFRQPLTAASMPGPRLEAEVGDTLLVHFRNRLRVPVTMHPHGVRYTPEMDGAYKGRYTDPGGFVQPGREHLYVWDCPPGTEGVWPYHDHGPLDPVPGAKGLFGLIHVRPQGAPRPAAEHHVVLHALLPGVTGFDRTFHCVNGRSYAGNTPTLRARIGQEVAQHVVALGDDLHTWHVHGHRWTARDGRVVDNANVGPAEVLSLGWTEDSPGRWLYHCHVLSHLHAGMAGWYLVAP